MKKRVGTLTSLTAIVVIQGAFAGPVTKDVVCAPPGAVASAAAVSEPVEVIDIVAERFQFTPSEIRVPVGTTVELRIRSEDTAHGFRIIGGNVDLLVPKRRMGEAVVVFDADEVGRYRFDCTRLCGAGHNFMQGEIVVTER